MKIILEVKENRFPFFLELVKSLDYKQKGIFIEEMAESLSGVKLHEQGKKKLKSAQKLLNETTFCSFDLIPAPTFL